MTMPDILPRIKALLKKSYLIYFLGWFFIYISIVTAVSVYSGSQAEKQFLKQIDRQLLIAAKSLKYMLAGDFHDRAVDKDSVSFDEEMRNRQAFSRFASETSLNYVYTLVPKNNKFYFSAPTITDEEASERKSWYFFPYDDAPAAFWQALKKNKYVFVNYSDQWGNFRSVALPQRSPSGRQYLACADYEISNLKNMLIDIRLRVISFGIIFFLASLPFLFFYRMAYNSYTDELKRKKAELEKYQLHLQELVDARTKELLAAKEEAEEASRMKSKLLSNVSHEIRTPLHAIIAFSELMLHSRSVDDMHAQVRTIMGESKVLLRLINDLLDQSRLEAGKLDLKSEPFYLHLLLDEVKKFMRPVAFKKGLTLNCEIDQRLKVCVSGDNYRLRQILVNLIGNAIKFTDEGFVRVEVVLSGEDNDNFFVTFKVVDTGMGIPPEKLKYIFEPFFQVDGGFKRKTPGTGLGTSIVKNLVERMGGRVACASELGKGSTFWFELPLKKCSQEEESKFKEKAAGIRPSLFSFEEYGASILVVEDNEVNQAVVRLQLNHLGINNISLAENGTAAIDACRNKNFDLVLADLHMPEMDGYEMAKRLRDLNDFYKAVPIIATTADTSGSVFDECKRSGIDDVLTKPITLGDLSALLKKWLKYSKPQN